MVFIHLILVGYAYVWLKGGLDIGLGQGAGQYDLYHLHLRAPPLPSAVPRRKRRVAA